VSASDDERRAKPTRDPAKGRELALAAMFHVEGHAPDERGDALERFWQAPPVDDDGESMTSTREPGPRAYADALVRQVLAEWTALDASIETCSRRWKLARMAAVERNVLRLALAELRHMPRTPTRVIVSEAVRIAGRYGSEHSARFVNGLLAELAAARGEREPADEPSSTHEGDDAARDGAE
jgi:N utilization substance protein B